MAKLQDVRRLKYAKEQFFGKTIFSKYHCDFLVLVLQGATEGANKKTFSWKCGQILGKHMQTFVFDKAADSRACNITIKEHYNTLVFFPDLKTNFSRNWF